MNKWKTDCQRLQWNVEKLFKENMQNTICKNEFKKKRKKDKVLFQNSFRNATSWNEPEFKKNKEHKKHKIGTERERERERERDIERERKRHQMNKHYLKCSNVCISTKSYK